LVATITLITVVAYRDETIYVESSPQQGTIGGQVVLRANTTIKTTRSRDRATQEEHSNGFWF